MISEIIRDLRQEKGLSQEQLAKSINLPRYTISNWEQGRTEPSLEHLRLLCSFFDIPADEILEIDSQSQRKKILIQNSFNNSKNINLKL